MVQRAHIPTPATEIDLLIETNALLREIMLALLPPRRSDSERISEGLVRLVTVVTADTPVQGPDVAINRGYGVVVRQRNHTVGAPLGYVAFSDGDVRNNATRIEMSDGDSFVIRVSNFNKIWFNANTAATNFEVFVER